MYALQPAPSLTTSVLPASCAVACDKLTSWLTSIDGGSRLVSSRERERERGEERREEVERRERREERSERGLFPMDDIKQITMKCSFIEGMHI